MTTYDCSTWELVRQWVVATSDLADLAWSPDGSCLAVWDAPAMGYIVAVYTPTGKLGLKSNIRSFWPALCDFWKGVAAPSSRILRQAEVGWWLVGHSPAMHRTA